MRGPPRAAWTNRVIAGILSLHACQHGVGHGVDAEPPSCARRRACPSGPERYSATRHGVRPRTPRSASSLPSSHRRHASPPAASRRPISPHQFSHSAPDLHGSVQPSTVKDAEQCDSDVVADLERMLQWLECPGVSRALAEHPDRIRRPTRDPWLRSHRIARHQPDRHPHHIAASVPAAASSSTAPAPTGFEHGSPFEPGLCALITHLHVTQVSMPIEFSPKVPAENSPLRYASQLRPKPRGGWTSAKTSRSSSTMAWRASAVALSRRLLGRASHQAAYSACKASSSATASCHR